MARRLLDQVVRVASPRRRSGAFGGGALLAFAGVALLVVLLGALVIGIGGRGSGDAENRSRPSTTSTPRRPADDSGRGAESISRSRPDRGPRGAPGRDRSRLLRSRCAGRRKTASRIGVAHLRDRLRRVRVRCGRTVHVEQLHELLRSRSTKRARLGSSISCATPSQPRVGPSRRAAPTSAVSYICEPKPTPHSSRPSSATSRRHQDR